MVTKSKRAYGRAWTWRVHISHSASVTDMLFQQKVRLSITWTDCNSMRIICEIHRSILYSLKILCIMMHFVKHSVLPRCPCRSTQWTWWFCSFKLTSVVGVFNKELKMSISVHMNDNWSIVYNIMIKIFKIFFIIS